MCGDIGLEERWGLEGLFVRYEVDKELGGLGDVAVLNLGGGGLKELVQHGFQGCWDGRGTSEEGFEGLPVDVRQWRGQVAEQQQVAEWGCDETEAGW